MPAIPPRQASRRIEVFGMFVGIKPPSIGLASVSRFMMSPGR
jgi:hypothetical protein